MAADTVRRLQVRMTASKIDDWVRQAARGEWLVYGHASAFEYPVHEALARMRELADHGLVMLVQRRLPDGRLAYVARRTGLRVGEAVHRSRLRAERPEGY